MHRERGGRPRAADRPVRDRAAGRDLHLERLSRHHCRRRRDFAHLGPNNSIGQNVVLVDAPDLCREDPAEAGERFARRVRDAIAELAARGLGLAAMIVDSVMSSDGVQSRPDGLLAPAATVVRDAGGLWIADEVQSGFGRLGHGWWGFTQHYLEPDLVVLGKPMGNAIPIAAVVGTEQALDRFGRDIRYFNTFAGNPVSIAAATAVLDVIERDDLIDNARQTGEHLLAGLRRIAEHHPSMAHVRGSGLFIAAEFVTDPDSLQPDPAQASDIVNRLRTRCAHQCLRPCGERPGRSGRRCPSTRLTLTTYSPPWTWRWPDIAPCAPPCC